LNDGKGEPIEIDAASHNGVESARELVVQMQSYPVGCKYKVFIIDEIHSMSQAAFQVLLKVLEEQPAKSVVCMATTNPEKIPATILSRVQTFQLSKISLEGINNRLKYIIEHENAEGRNITYTDDAILFISKMAGGGLRDAITLLDKALSFDTNITIESLQKSLGLPSYEDYFEMLNAIARKDNQTIVKIVNSVYNSGVNFVKWFDEFFSFVTNIVKFIVIDAIIITFVPTNVS
jgi:DNA polymerase-3 subunit gamma/tau